MIKILIALAIAYLSIVLFCIIVKLIIGFAGAFKVAKWEWEINHQEQINRRKRYDHSTDRQ